ncbi:MAG TPA: hypothetical protein VLU94_01950, partial [Candidatus Nitrosotalea sp.]|nr:hypothetical protein [Candidatus Nitrosotalea sp.]
MNEKLKKLIIVGVVQFFTCVTSVGQVNPHRIQTLTPLPDGGLLIGMTGNAAPQFRPYFDIFPVDVSGNLTDWTPLDSLLRTNSSTNLLTYIDAGAIGKGTRFYRMFTNSFPTPLPKPDGPSTVATTSLLLTDPSRTDRYNVATNSSFMITLWFPAPPEPGALPRPYIESKLAPGLANLYGTTQSLLSGFYGHASMSVVVATNQSP